MVLVAMLVYFSRIRNSAQSAIRSLQTIWPDPDRETLLSPDTLLELHENIVQYFEQAEV